MASEMACFDICQAVRELRGIFKKTGAHHAHGSGRRDSLPAFAGVSFLLETGAAWGYRPQVVC